MANSAEDKSDTDPANLHLEKKNPKKREKKISQNQNKKCCGWLRAEGPRTRAVQQTNSQGRKVLSSCVSVLLFSLLVKRYVQRRDKRRGGRKCGRKGVGGGGGTKSHTFLPFCLSRQDVKGR